MNVINEFDRRVKLVMSNRIHVSIPVMKAIIAVLRAAAEIHEASPGKHPKLSKAVELLKAEGEK